MAQLVCINNGKNDDCLCIDPYKRAPQLKTILSEQHRTFSMF